MGRWRTGMVATVVVAAWMLAGCKSTSVRSSPRTPGTLAGAGQANQYSSDPWETRPRFQSPSSFVTSSPAPEGTVEGSAISPVEQVASGGSSSPDDYYRPAPPMPPKKQVKELVALAAKYMDEGHVDDALITLDQAIAENPEMEELQLAAGDIHRKRGDYEKAAALYERATQVNPASFDAHYFLGLMRQLLGKYGEAISSYLYALAIEPENFNANHHIATVYIQINRPAEAVHYARKATQLRHSDQGAWANLAVCYSLMRLYEKAVDAYRQAAELGELADPIALGLADAHIKLDHFDRAIAVLRVQVKRNPSSIAYERLGYAQYKSKRYENAMANFRASLLYDPNYTQALNGLGVSMMTAYIQTDRRTPSHRDEAMALWQRSIQLKPGQPKIVRLIEQFQLW